MSKQQTLLEQIIQQAQHFFMRRRTEYVLDTIAKEVIIDFLFFNKILQLVQKYFHIDFFFIF